MNSGVPDSIPKLDCEVSNAFEVEEQKILGGTNEESTKIPTRTRERWKICTVDEMNIRIKTIPAHEMPSSISELNNIEDRLTQTALMRSLCE